jgi:hypothetical protein
MIGAFAVLDLLVSLVTYSGHPLSVIVAYLTSGVIAAQAAFLAVLHALGPGPLIRRTLIAWSLGAACVLLWFLGVAIYHRFRLPLEDSRELLASMTLVPFFVLMKGLLEVTFPELYDTARHTAGKWGLHQTPESWVNRESHGALSGFQQEANFGGSAAKKAARPPVARRPWVGSGSARNPGIRTPERSTRSISPLYEKPPTGV